MLALSGRMSLVPRGLQNSMGPVGIRHNGDKMMIIIRPRLNSKSMLDKGTMRLNAKNSGRCVKTVVSEHPHLLCAPTKIEIEIDRKAAPVKRLANAGLPTIENVIYLDSSKDSRG